jgi:hypothetical protein
MPPSNSNAARQLASLLRATKPGPQQPASSRQQHPASEAVEPAPAEQQLPPSESEESCSNLLTASKKEKCAATNKSGNPCGSYRSPGSEFCPFHRPEYAARMQEARIEGGRRSPYQLPDQIDPDIWNVDFSLYSRGGLQASMEAVMRLLILGRIPTRHASILMRFFDAAIRNLHGVETLAGPDYADSIGTLMLASGLIERDLEDLALKERVRQIADVGSKRQEVLKANEAFGYTPQQPKQQPTSKAMQAWDHDQPHRERESLVTAFWGPGTGEGGKLTMQDLFPNGIPSHQQSG